MNKQELKSLLENIQKVNEMLTPSSMPVIQPTATDKINPVMGTPPSPYAQSPPPPPPPPPPIPLWQEYGFSSEKEFRIFLLWLMHPEGLPQNWTIQEWVDKNLWRLYINRNNNPASLRLWQEAYELIPERYRELMFRHMHPGGIDPTEWLRGTPGLIPGSPIPPGQKGNPYVPFRIV